MDGPQLIIGAVFIALVLIGGGIVVSYGAQTSAIEYDASETVTTGNVSEVVELNNSSSAHYWEEDVKITTSNNKVLVQGEDYDWYVNNGTFEVLSDQAANTEVTVEYHYGAQTETQQEATTIAALILESGAWIPMIIIFALVLFAVSALNQLST